MDLEIKKNITSNWFKILQNTICDSIIKLEKNKINIRSTTWKRNPKKDEGGGGTRVGKKSERGQKK